MAAFGIVALHPTASRTHILGYAGTATTWILGVWNGSTSSSEKFVVHTDGDVICGPRTAVALATTATDGFLFIRTCAGVPTGVPTNDSAGKRVAVVYDTTNEDLYVYNSAWVKVALA